MLSQNFANRIQLLKRKNNVPFWFGLLCLLILVFGVFLWKSFPSGSFNGSSSSWYSGQKWTEFAHNPVLPDVEHSDKIGTVFDLGLWRENMTITGIPTDIYYHDHDDHVKTAMIWRMWNSHRSSRSIAYSTSVDGRNWVQDLQTALGPGPDSAWDAVVNRPFVKKIATGKYGMWYTGQDQGTLGAKIGYAESADGITFKPVQEKPVLEPTLLWEKLAIMTPSVIDLPDGALRMYYSAGETYEPDAIGIAHSYDGGLTWVKHGDPIFEPDRTSGKVGVWFDSHKVTSPHVIRHDGYFYMFYAGFRNTDYSSVGLVRSKDGLTNWERHIGNPIVDAVKESWNCDSVYKPFAGWSEENQEWLLWYNGRCGPLERIGVSILKAKSFSSFVKRD